MRMNVVEKYLHVCSIVGSMKKKADRRKACLEISEELMSGGVLLDNLFYEQLGVSGDDMIESLYK